MEENTNGEFSETSQLTTHHYTPLQQSCGHRIPNLHSWLSQGLIEAAAEPELPVLKIDRVEYDSVLGQQSICGKKHEFDFCAYGSLVISNLITSLFKVRRSVVVGYHSLSVGLCIGQNIIDN